MSIMKLASASILALSLSVATFAGGPKLVSGDASVLKGEKLFNIEAVWTDSFEFDGDPFSEYYADEIKHYQKKNKVEDQKEFEDDWSTWKKETYPKGFSEGFNSFLEKKMGVKAELNATDAKYTLKIETIEIDPGGSSLAEVELKVIVVETNNPENVIAVIEGVKAGGRLPGPEKVRVQDAYRMAGILFSRSFLYKKVLKD